MPVINGTSGDDILTGTALADEIYGSAGNDQLHGLAGDDLLDGGDGIDSIYDGSGSDQVFGGLGDDTIYASIGAGSDVFDGGADVDGVGYVFALSGVIVDLAIGQARSTGGADEAGIGIDQLISIENAHGTNFDDVLTGNSEANYLAAYGGNDQLVGGDGDDRLYGGAGNDLIDGGTGVDWAEFMNAPIGVTVSLAISGAQNTGDGIDTLSGIENLSGSLSNDLLTGNEFANTILGWDGSDHLVGGAGDDRLSGGTGADQLDGGTGADELGGEAGDDQLFGGADNDTLYGHQDNDTLDGGTGADFMSGGTENDTYIVDNDGDIVVESMNAGTDTVRSSVAIFLASNVENLELTGAAALNGWGNGLGNVIAGNSGNNTLYGLDGNDVLLGNGGSDSLYGGNGDDVLRAGAGNDLIDGGTGMDWADYGFSAVGVTVSLSLVGAQNTGGAGVDVLTGIEHLAGTVSSDTLTGDAGNNELIAYGGDDLLVGLGGDDRLLGLGGNDELNGGAGEDELIGGEGDDEVDAGDDDDWLEGNEGSDILTAGGGDDYLWGDEGNDTLSGGSGNDSLQGGEGADTMSGGTGNDFYSIDHAGDVVVENDDAGDDSVSTPFSHVLGSNFENLQLSGTAAVNGTGNALDNMINGNSAANELSGGEGIDYLYGREGNDTLSGGAGGDFLAGDAGADLLLGGDGDDDLNGGEGADVLRGAAGDDRYIVDDANDVVEEANDQGRDVVFSSISYTLGINLEALRLIGQAAVGNGNAVDNVIEGNDSANILHGLGGDDLLNGLGGNDQIHGDDGADNLWGGDGDDLLDGGTGADVMSGAGGNDRYKVDHVGDSVQEYGGEGLDVVESSVSYDIKFFDVEHLILTGVAAIDGTGSDIGNIIQGNAGANVLTGKGGADILTGGGGIDTFKDTAAGLNGDTITDLKAGDSIVITDTSLAGFSFSLSGSTLTFTGGSLTLTGFTGQLQVSAAAGGGVQLTVVPSLSQTSRAGDFNGDGRSDIFWRHEDGRMTDWLGLANGGFFDNAPNASTWAPTEWQVIGVGDFNGDNRDDILWRHDDGRMTDWLGAANGGFIDNVANASTWVPTEWHVAGTGDFNGDNRDDILWRHDDGRLTDWLGAANGGFIDNAANALTSVPIGWHIAGTGDFNGDNRDDILWRHNDGRMTDWLGATNGGFIDNAANALTVVPTEWHIAGTGDFNGDNRDDILWRHDDGRLTNWLGAANGGFVDNVANASTWVPVPWQVASIGDFNGDNRDDILWRHDDGRLTNWLGLANGGFLDNVANASTWVPTQWHVQAIDSPLV